MRPLFEQEDTKCNVTHSIKNDTAVVSLTGEFITILDVDGVQAELKKIMEKKTFSRLVFDLKNLRHLNSKGLGLFITYYHALRKQQRELGICSCSPHVLNLVKITHLDSVFKIYDNEDQATAR
jgi:anti-anti-sigma factor